MSPIVLDSSSAMAEESPNTSQAVVTTQTAQPHNFEYCSLQNQNISPKMYTFDECEAPHRIDYCSGDHNYPPALIAASPIPLPPLASEPILVHPLLAYHVSPPIRYNLEMPPSSASLALALAERVSRQYWGNQPAMSPATVGSITIRVAGVERPIVVFPNRLDEGVVTVDDVLCRVHEAFHASSVGDGGWDFSTASSADRWCSRDGHCGASAHARRRSGSQTTSTFSRDLRSNIWWGGLAPSTAEGDVWILHINVTSTA